jgi:hypothetical protein
VLVADPDQRRYSKPRLPRIRRSSPKPVANWVLGEYLRQRNAAGGRWRVDRIELGAIVRAVVDGSISRAQGRQVPAEHVEAVARHGDHRRPRVPSDHG